VKSISVKTSEREEMIDITSKVEAVLSRKPSTTSSPAAGATPPIQEESGVCVLFVQHTTCGLTVNENADPDVQSDMLGWLRRLVPQYPKTTEENHPVGETPPPRSSRKEGSPELFFKHFEHNSDAHIKSSLVGSSVTVPFENGKLCLGRWHGIYLCEFDGPRERTVLVSVART
jgi:thiamine phosphate synthase YjbQ (UPF0047 family)